MPAQKKSQAQKQSQAQKPAPKYTHNLTVKFQVAGDASRNELTMNFSLSRNGVDEKIFQEILEKAKEHWGIDKPLVVTSLKVSPISSTPFVSPDVSSLIDDLKAKRW